MPLSLASYWLKSVSLQGHYLTLKRKTKIYEEKGVTGICRVYQIEHENDILRPGTGFQLVKSASAD